MNKRTEILGTNCKPELTIVVYKSTDSSPQYYLESHQVNEQGQIMEGKPLKQETIQSMVEFFYDDRKDRSQISGNVPSNILSYSPLPGGNYRLIWHRPAETRFIHFAKQLKIQSGKANVPAMLYIVDRETLSVYALKNDERPTEKTKIFRAPFHNVPEDAEVCLGNAKVKKPIEKTFESVAKYWEDLFWLSEFAHMNGTDPTRSGLDKVWKRLVKSKGRLKWSQLNELKETKHKSLKGILR